MNKWDNFFEEKIKKIFEEKRVIIDIGGGLRVLKNKGNRYDPKRQWIQPLIKAVDYKILDPVPDYSPDIVGDIHELPFEDNSIDAIICLAVLEHVENPIQAASEMHRVLKPGGYALIYVPFLYYYHPKSGYYKDYWRFTRDSVDVLFKDFSHKEIINVCGALESWLKNSPLGRIDILVFLSNKLDKLINRQTCPQSRGFYIFLAK